MILDRSHVILHHNALGTTFKGVDHPISSPDVPIHQFRGIKYASVPARFRQSKLVTSYPSSVDATRHGPICPQPDQKSLEEELLGLSDSDIPRQVFKQDEFECLNLNITCPAGHRSKLQLPVMVWIHGGGNRGCGSSWVYDGGALVRKSVRVGKPIIMVTINFRIGVFGVAASPHLADDNRAAGDEGVGNYGLRDQRQALEWVNRYIADFGGDPSNVTLFGHSSGAADIVAHLHSNANLTCPLFSRAIVQSAIIEHSPPELHSAGWQLSRALAPLRSSCVAQLRAVDPESLVNVNLPFRAVDDGVFFRKGFKDFICPPSESEEPPRAPLDRGLNSLRFAIRKDKSKSRSPRPLGNRMPTIPPTPTPGLQPLLIGDCACDSSLWSQPAHQWAAPAVVRRVRAICQSITKSSALLNAYEIAPHTLSDDLTDRLLEFVEDARIAWPTECVVQAEQRSGRQVWRYVFDQEGPARGMPHHAADLIYLFDNVSLALSAASSPTAFDDDESLPSLPSSRSTSADVGEILGKMYTVDELELMDVDKFSYGPEWSFRGWAQPVVDEMMYAHVRDAIQERWIEFAQGERPWDTSRGKVYVFGPEGETGERSAGIFGGRRRQKIWEGVLKPLGMTLVQKVAQELSNGPGLARVTVVSPAVHRVLLKVVFMLVGITTSYYWVGRLVCTVFFS
ncbi:Alpha/Beta hydrolase protein [Suillus paluster]|uniref:Alpha/Beta hydrolase protein n=1 Tax=Suillus paluster TaxID=48578 RepID=UPI001B87ACCE|nr:Alpha/Beta hydrolase protein [Suillus paluster]KAG1741475.1 Alpha/Beta hydrolase protein [Suillus paluster]